MAVLGLRTKRTKAKGRGDDNDGWVSFTRSTVKVMVKVILTR